MSNQPLPRTFKDEPGYAAIFVDFESMTSFLGNQGAGFPEANEQTLQIVRNLRTYLRKELNIDPILQYVYADFENQSGDLLRSLYLMGIEARNVPGTEHGNEADLFLCMDAVRVLHTRSDIKLFVLVGGNRTYIPLIRQIQHKARRVLAVAFRGNLSGDLLYNVGENNFIEALTLGKEKCLSETAHYAREEAFSNGEVNHVAPAQRMEMEGAGL